MSEQCYYCGEPSINREHVPPKCFFPEGADKNYRVNLITVPSCELHNSGKSGDDQYMMIYFAAGARGLDYEKIRPYIDKVCRTIKRTPHIISEFSNQIKFIPADTSVPKVEVDWYAPENAVELLCDPQRIGRFLAAVARGLFFEKNKAAWAGAVIVIPHFLGELITDSGDNHTQLRSALINPEGALGDNKEIFYYDIFAADQSDIAYMVDMCFYQQYKVTCHFVSKEMREKFYLTYGHVEFVCWSE
ncbi:hypothetical protein ACX3YG_18790 [Pseudomonas wadenswilerensis]